MATKVWARNPQFCVRECVETGVTRFVWNKGYIRNRNLDPEKFIRLHLGVQDFEMMVVDPASRRAEIVCRDCQVGSACVTYPVWVFGDAWETLISSIESGGVVVVDVPTGTGTGKAFVRTLGELQEQNPRSFIHMHGLFSYRLAFGFGIGSVDLNFREPAACGTVILPSGLKVSEAEARSKWAKWIKLVGMPVKSVKEPRQRCIYNIRSALWASENFRSNVKFLVKSVPVDPDCIEFDVPQATRIMLKNIQPVDGDRFLCDACSVKTSCRYFRVGSVCTVPDAEVSELAELFGTRDSDAIIDGLAKLLEIQSERFKKGVDSEEDGVNPDVTKLGGVIFDQGVKLAKLIDPSLDRKPGTNISIGAGGGAISGTSARELMAAIARELEARGVPREDITPELVEQVLKLPERERHKAIAEAVG